MRLIFVLLKISILVHYSYSIPACIIIDTNMLSKSHETNQTKSSDDSVLFRNLRMLEQNNLLTDNGNSPPLDPLTPSIPVPLSYIDLKPFQHQQQEQKTVNESQQLLTSMMKRNYVAQLSGCTTDLLQQAESQMVVPFEFRRLRIDEPDRRTKFPEYLESVPDLAVAVYERRSQPEGMKFCRTCRNGLWTQLSVCETVRCDADLLRGYPRLVTEWGEIKQGDLALYPPNSVYAVYPFGFGPHCKQCEEHGEWSRYALAELCIGIKFWNSHSTSTATDSTTTQSNSKVTTQKETNRTTTPVAKITSIKKA
ncbi:unnamed protein product [Didymodactylos carnosus]|uniref:Uncharacterized protein n=1 Tax=Didymodactylos carnosus TaxID=1234261 RepID=A0A813R8P3_9BILA|nr:unnamed protein product [Didymodactylos carnosus]CAF1388062.1 unnamed protein product [Didymodactylos carnosus]CAF3563088.1 unnamed protein product [Didymodactylos carnosus]CAF4195920.1 unnamed protein product [Didymodactylos carnosus]